MRRQIRIKTWSVTAYHFSLLKKKKAGGSMILMLINPVTNEWVESLSSIHVLIKWSCPGGIPIYKMPASSAGLFSPYLGP